MSPCFFVLNYDNHLLVFSVSALSSHYLVRKGINIFPKILNDSFQERYEVVMRRTLDTHFNLLVCVM